NTPELDPGAESTLRLDNDNEPQPDVLIRLPEHAGGKSKVTDDGYIEGPVEFVAEVAASSVSIDLHAKLNAYRRNSIREYVVWQVENEAVVYFVLRDGQYVPLVTDADGFLKSELFPGLWLDPQAILRGNLKRLFAVIDQGCATPEHAAF